MVSGRTVALFDEAVLLDLFSIVNGSPVDDL